MASERTVRHIGGFRMHAVHRGHGDPVVLLHGLSGSHRWWRYTVPALEVHYRVHLPELVGFGNSRGAARQPAIGELAALVLRWLDAVGADRIHFVGHSMGAQVGIHLAARWPDRVRRLALVGAAGIPRELTPRRLARFGARLARPRAWGRITFLRTIAADAARAGPVTLGRATHRILADDVRPLLPRIQAPTLLVWGENDPLTPLEDGRLMREIIPGSRLEVVPRAAHNPMADRPRLFNDLLLGFLEAGRREP